MYSEYTDRGGDRGPTSLHRLAYEEVSPRKERFVKRLPKILSYAFTTLAVVVALLCPSLYTIGTRYGPMGSEHQHITYVDNLDKLAFDFPALTETIIGIAEDRVIRPILLLCFLAAIIALEYRKARDGIVYPCLAFVGLLCTAFCFVVAFSMVLPFFLIITGIGNQVQ